MHTTEKERKLSKQKEGPQNSVGHAETLLFHASSCSISNGANTHSSLLRHKFPSVLPLRGLSERSGSACTSSTLKLKHLWDLPITFFWNIRVWILEEDEAQLTAGSYREHYSQRDGCGPGSFLIACSKERKKKKSTVICIYFFHVTYLFSLTYKFMFHYFLPHNQSHLLPSTQQRALKCCSEQNFFFFFFFLTLPCQPHGKERDWVTAQKSHL